MHQLWTPERLFRVSCAILVALFGALIAHLFFFPYPVSMLNAGDFPGFYVQAVLLKKGLYHELYNFELQRQIENEYWPLFNGLYYPSAYPPFTALLLYPLSFFERQTAQNFFLGFMILCYSGALFYLKHLNTSLKEKGWSIGILSLLFAPVFCGVFAAQNTALSMLLAIFAIKLQHEETNKSSFFAGAAIALWFFKPQYGALFLIGSLCIRPDILLLLGSVVTLGIMWIATALVFGASWVSWWIHKISFFDALNLTVNSKEAVSLRGFITALGADFTTGWIVTLASLALLFAELIATRNRLGILQRFALFLAALPLVSPQTLFYDLSLGLSGLLLVSDYNRDRSVWILWTLTLLGAISFLLRESAFITPFFPVGALLLIFVIYEVFSDKKPA